MSFSIYQASIPIFVQYLTSLSGILGKAAAHAEARKIDPSVFLNGRLAPDMYPLIKQVQIVTDHAKGAAARLAGAEVPSYPDNETSFAELHARIAKTLDFVKSVKPAQFDGAEDRQIELQFGPRKVSFTGQAYLCQFALPNFFFHGTAAYGILRHLGVEIGKRDFMGA